MLKILLILILVKQHLSLELQYCSNAPPDQVCKLVDDYDKNVVPGKLPLTISPGLDVHEVVEIDTFKGTMTVLVYVYVFWTDPNLSYKPEKMLVQLCINYVPYNSYFLLFYLSLFLFRKNGIAFSEETAKLIWHPFLSFLNIKEMKPMRGFGYDEHHEYYLSGTSDFQSVEILEVTVHCNYELTLFPFDYQECDFSLFELRNDVDSVILKEFVLFYKSHLNVKNLPQQYGIPYEIAMKSHVENVTWDAFGQYSISTLRFSMQRNSIDLLLGSFYIPTGLFGFLSMASYIMNPDTVSIYY